MILSTRAAADDYNSVSQSLTNEGKQWENKLNEELYKMVYMQLYNRIRREAVANNIRSLILKMDRAKLW